MQSLCFDMKKILISFLLPITLLLGACSEYKKGKGALQYKIVHNQNSPAIGKLAVVFLSYTEATESGTVLSSTATFDPRPIEVYATRPQFEGDLQDAFQYLSEGDSAIVKVSMDSIKRFNHSVQLAKDTSKYMVYTLKINRVFNQEGKNDTTFLPRVEAYKRAELLRQQAIEDNKIKHFLAVKKLNYKTTASGLWYPADLKTTNNTGKALYVSYVISSLDGKVYETNVLKTAQAGGIYRPYKIYQARKMTPGQGHFAGFEEAITLLQKGAKTKVIIPSKLAYGARGDNTDMPPFTPLLCEFELLNQ
ncbi:hypothetical protein EZ428_21720 [Pedobacter frigiditerrae]|uniref:Peptidyl-prolyl cis-trans isomerase n=2 Tax=Pedobacter frigiditerrae TaxID=2530452 RepID=A0A4R0ML00_9SPHI|nr:hypothetical protein EZ428_21720 [Pedobacter frigiditerrae]